PGPARRAGRPADTAVHLCRRPGLRLAPGRHPRPPDDVPPGKAPTPVVARPSRLTIHSGWRRAHGVSRRVAPCRAARKAPFTPIKENLTRFDLPGDQLLLDRRWGARRRRSIAARAPDPCPAAADQGELDLVRSPW